MDTYKLIKNTPLSAFISCYLAPFNVNINGNFTVLERNEVSLTCSFTSGVPHTQNVTFIEHGHEVTVRWDIILSSNVEKMEGCITFFKNFSCIFILLSRKSYQCAA